MNIKIEKNEMFTKVMVEGRLDTTTAPLFDEEIFKSIDDVKDLVLDFAELEYVSSAGLRVILKAQKHMNTKGTMKIINVNEMIMEVFEITGFIDILTIE